MNRYFALLIFLFGAHVGKHGYARSFTEKLFHEQGIKIYDTDVVTRDARKKMAQDFLLERIRTLFNEFGQPETKVEWNINYPLLEFSLAPSDLDLYIETDSNLSFKYKDFFNGASGRSPSLQFDQWLILCIYRHLDFTRMIGSTARAIERWQLGSTLRWHIEEFERLKQKLEGNYSLAILDLDDDRPVAISQSPFSAPQVPWQVSDLQLMDEALLLLPSKLRQLASPQYILKLGYRNDMGEYLHDQNLILIGLPRSRPDLFKLSLLHEWGHALWIQLDAKTRERFAKLSWSSPDPREGVVVSGSQFMTSYAQKNLLEDFAEHFAYGLMFPEQTQQKAAEKFNFLRNEIY